MNASLPFAAMTARSVGYVVGSLVFAPLLVALVRWLAAGRSRPFTEVIREPLTLIIALVLIVLVAVSRSADRRTQSGAPSPTPHVAPVQPGPTAPPTTPQPQ